MRILITAATPFEIAPTLHKLEQFFQHDERGFFHHRTLEVLPLVTGVGMVATVFHLKNCLSIFGNNPPDLVINAGIAGSFDAEIGIGEVVNVITERFADVGVENADGQFSDLFDLELMSANTPPFLHRKMHNPAAAASHFLKNVHGGTVNRVTGSLESIEKMKKKYPDLQIESMEGAAFFYTCLLEKVNFLEIRSISNHVEPRDRSRWNLPLAIDNLNAVLWEILNEYR